MHAKTPPFKASPTVTARPNTKKLTAFACTSISTALIHHFRMLLNHWRMSNSNCAPSTLRSIVRRSQSENSAHAITAYRIIPYESRWDTTTEHQHNSTAVLISQFVGFQKRGGARFVDIIMTSDKASYKISMQQPPGLVPRYGAVHLYGCNKRRRESSTDPGKSPSPCLQLWSPLAISQRHTQQKQGWF